jgi:hypothetical protein
MGSKMQVWADTLVCQFCGALCRRKMTFGITGARVLCDECASPFRTMMLSKPKAAALDDEGKPMS